MKVTYPQRIPLRSYDTHVKPVIRHRATGQSPSEEEEQEVVQVILKRVAVSVGLILVLLAGALIIMITQSSQPRTRPEPIEQKKERVLPGLPGPQSADVYQPRRRS